MQISRLKNNINIVYVTLEECSFGAFRGVQTNNQKNISSLFY